MKIVLIGPFDRYNYGDVLFPSIVSSQLDKLSTEFDIVYAAYREVDFTNIGGVKTIHISNIYKPGFMNDGDAIIVVGGDVLAVNFTLVNNQLHENNVFIHKVISKLKKEAGLAKMFGVESKYPWVVDYNNIDAKINIAYNAVGGYFDNYADDKKDLLSHSTYFSSRDIFDYDLLNDINCNLSIDSAFIMSDVYPPSFLESQSKLILVEEYIVFQMQYSSFKKNKNSIINQIKLLSASEKYVYLLGIGYAKGHDDISCYNEIKKQVKNDNVTILDDLTIFDIMHVINNAKLFIGTSLHGSITAHSFNTPHMGIDQDIKKLVAYYDKFESGRLVCDINDFYQEYNKIPNCDDETIFNLKQMVYENFSKMFKELGLYE